MLKNYFTPDSIANRVIPSSANFAPLDDVWVQMKQGYFDLVTYLETNPKKPTCEFYLNNGFNMPGRSQQRGGLLFTRNLDANAGVQELSTCPTGNGITLIHDPQTDMVDELGAAYRSKAGAPILFEQSRPGLHYSASLSNAILPNPGGVRGSGLSGAMGVIRPGELSNKITHVLAGIFPGSTYFANCKAVWPACRVDAIATNPTYGYKGKNRYFTLGTLVAIPPSTDLSKIKFITSFGPVLAAAAQTYGIYAADSTAAAGSKFALAMDWSAYSSDLGGIVNPANGFQSFGKINGNALQADMLTVLNLCQAVINNSP